MAHLTIRRRSKKERALRAASKMAAAAGKFVKARIAWLAGKKATKVAAPAVAVGTAAVVAKKRSGAQHQQDAAPAPVDATPPTPAGVS